MQQVYLGKFDIKRAPLAGPFFGLSLLFYFYSAPVNWNLPELGAIHDLLLEVIHLKFEIGADVSRQIHNWWDDGGAMGRESWFRVTLLGFFEGEA